MALDATGRTRVWAHLMRIPEFGGVAVTKAELKAAVDATDDWIEAAQGAGLPSLGFNSTLPLPFRSAANTQQKTVLFCMVAMRRAGLLWVAEDGG